MLTPSQILAFNRALGLLDSAILTHEQFIALHHDWNFDDYPSKVEESRNRAAQDREHKAVILGMIKAHNSFKKEKLVH
ncbi:hypothetical protein [Paenibacillus hexagrammi]|uniref:Uncharacterized protein n=1 Tax=Paenibacillus hexagrammi TaxID=2908839 RepID=A0ABY3STU2_9BACL|nr:hypothetical protein [Paenibacillus sp. YPD9-1]UJF36561.1 hypothetical protein L0M14_30705 [Paenibacillus sp. YPD9-1]